MELDGNTIDGHWAEDTSLGVEFFIINDATFSKLCILGDDVEPCYEGSSVTSPKISSDFSKENFENTLFTMMEELKRTLNSKGGLDMSETTEEKDFNLENEVTSEQNEIIDTESVSEEETNFEETQENDEVDSETVEGENKDESDTVDDKEYTEENQEIEQPEFTTEQFEAMSNELESLRAEVQELRDFKLQIENQRKQAILDKYFMISEDDKKEIIENMANYSVKDIEAKLALMYVEQNVDFTKVDGQSDDEPSPALAFSLEEEADLEPLTDLQRVLRETRN